MLEGNHSHEKETLQLYKLYLKHGDARTLERMKQAMQYQNLPEKLAEQVTQLIRLQDMAMSVSEAGTVCKLCVCIFPRYILRLEERQIHGIDNRNVGMIMHGAMEQMFCYVRDQKEQCMGDTVEQERDAKTEEFVNENFAKEYAGQELDAGSV